MCNRADTDYPTRRWGINGCDGWCGVGVGVGVHKDERGEQTNSTQNRELTAKFVADTKTFDEELER